MCTTIYAHLTKDGAWETEEIDTVKAFYDFFGVMPSPRTPEYAPLALDGCLCQIDVPNEFDSLGIKYTEDLNTGGYEIDWPQRGTRVVLELAHCSEPDCNRITYLNPAPWNCGAHDDEERCRECGVPRVWNGRSYNLICDACGNEA